MSSILPTTATGADFAAGASGLTSIANRFGSYVRLDPQAWESVREESRKRLEGLRSWGEFFDISRFGLPRSLAVFTQRLSFNLKHFQNNYLLITFFVVAFFLITQPFLLISLVFFAVGFKWISSLPANEPTTIAGAKFSQMQLWGAYAAISLLILFFTGIQATIFWVVVVCAAVVCAHAGCIDKPVEAEFGEEEV
ncbi:Prenylated Rab acceptor 1 [Polyrhizophydium stewartii]|uniref:PRA1 family protein n=1 Tax=Polyrhizophydium stewartii TaxID=2732419 RepID=A0ABR4NDR2_9FUNG